MRNIDIRRAGSQLSKLVDQAAGGDPFIITKAGKPLVKVAGLDAPTKAGARRIGFMAGQMTVPDDFDRFGNTEIEELLGGA